MIKSDELSKAIGIKSSRFEGPSFCSNISTDSRTLKQGEIFVALQGDNFDAFDFIESICKAKPAAIVYNFSREREKEITRLASPECFLIGVDDSLVYLQSLGQLHVKAWKSGNNKKVIGITGSNGKTTTKEILFHLLNECYPGKIHATQGNFNNHIGVPLTLAGLSDEHELAIVELGTNHPGEIGFLCKLADPDLGLITNIGSSHLEFFHTEEAVFVEKRHLYDYVVAQKGIFVINGDDPFLSTLNTGITFGQEEGGDYKISFGNQTVELSKGEEKVRLDNQHIVGKHNFYNVVASYILAKNLVPQLDLKPFVQSFKPKNNRSSWIEHKGVKVFLDAYNANPSSMESALDSFKEYCTQNNIELSQAAIVVGDMNELGEQAGMLHQQLGERIRQLGFIAPIFIGRYAKNYGEGFGSCAQTFEAKDDFDWDLLMRNISICFIKGSRSLKLETLVQMR